MSSTAGLIYHPVVIEVGQPVLEIAGFLKSSAVDGPGNRAVVFLQGCNFDCIACHNPSTIGRCDGCGACVPVCPHAALSSPTSGIVIYEAAPCDRCRACLTVCPIDSDPAIRVVPAEMVIDEIRPLAPFITGVTVTGGEPTIQLDGLIGLFAGIKADDELSHLTTLVDSNGTLSRRGWKQLIPVMDGAMIDLKAASPALHQELTGHPNDAVKDSIRFLAEENRLAEVRLLVIEGVTDTPDELNAWVEFVAGVDPDIPVRVMPFRHQGTRPVAQHLPETTSLGLERVASRLHEGGLTRVSS